VNKVYIERLPPTESDPAATREPSAVSRALPASPGSLTPDPISAEFLLRCLSASSRPLAVSRQPSAVWNGVLAIAVRHGLTPLLYSRLKQSGAQASVPADVWERLRRAYRASAVRSMSLYGELRKVLERLRSSGIKVTMLKGAYLGEAVYGDAALRPMVDVDLLVPRADLPKAQAVLLDMGGVHQQFEDIESTCKTKCHIPQVHIRDLTIEIHWNIASPTGPVRVDADVLWNRARPAATAGVEVLALSPEDLLLHLCLHTSYKDSLGAGLRPLCDIAETIRRFRSEVDWAQVGERAREWGASRHVGLTLHLARSMLAAGVPDDALEQLVPGGLDKRILETARKAVLAQAGYGQWLPFFAAIHTTTLADKARLSWKRVFLSREEMAATYPGSRRSRFLCFYYARRVGHVVRSYAVHTLRRAHLMASSPERESAAALVRWLKSGTS
jgi:hypothetical protein